MFKTSRKHPKAFQRETSCVSSFPTSLLSFHYPFLLLPHPNSALSSVKHCTQFHISPFRWHNLEHSSATCKVTRKLRVAIGQLLGTTSRTLSTINRLLLHRMAQKSVDTTFNMLPLLSSDLCDTLYIHINTPHMEKPLKKRHNQCTDYQITMHITHTSNKATTVTYISLSDT